MPNRLQHESSPYLLQHANNPVDWYPWGEEALELAKKTDRPILVSIGYATCHWCHVMEHESFEDEKVAAFMNKHFVNVKVDREERPDLDQIYMTACQAINRSGGWPLNCFLLPDGRPFYANTYFPPTSAYRRPSWSQVLQNIANHFQDKRDVVEGQAKQLMEIIQGQQGKKVAFDPAAEIGEELFDFASLEHVFYKFRERFDRENGGFGGAPKFPGTHSLTFLLDYGLQFDNQEALAHVKQSLLAMVRGGIYDHLMGGFARYTVDAKWIIPHFEKMAYDNGLLLELMARYLDHFPDEELRAAWLQTLAWLKAEMLDTALFYSALDADSEGVEGKFYVWSHAELAEILSPKALSEMSHSYQLTEEGNWEGNNILYRTASWEKLAEELNTDQTTLMANMASARAQLLRARALRVRPGLDDKQILSWNALLIKGLLAGKALLSADELSELKDWVDKVPQVFGNKTGDRLYRLYKDGMRKQAGFLEDYAFWIDALIEAYHAFWEEAYLLQAKHWLEIAIALFEDPDDAQFFFAPAEQSDSVHRGKEQDDGALPSANGKMARALWYLGMIFDQPAWRSRAIQQLSAVREMAEKYPVSMGHWLQFGLQLQAKLPEIAIVGPEAQKFAEVILSNMKLRPIIMVNNTELDDFPLLRNRQIGEQTQIFICKEYSCHSPIQSTSEAIQLLKDI